MNIYNFLNIQSLSNLEIPSAAQIEDILRETASPIFAQFGLKNKNHKYIWEGEYGSNEIKNIIRFSYRAETGNLIVAKNFKFLPAVNPKYELKNTKIDCHLFEFIEYFKDSVGISLWNRYFFKKILKRFLKKYTPAIRDFFESTNDIQSTIKMAIRQLNDHDSGYEIHFPNQKYVLAFLYAKKGDKEKALTIMDEFMKEKSVNNPKLIVKLKEI